MTRDWLALAACIGAPDAVFFPSEHAGRNATFEAKAICRGCPVRLACLADCMAAELHGRRYGVCGGLSAPERRELGRTS